MRGKSVPAILLPVILAAGLGACANNGVQPGIVNTASALGSGSASASTYGSQSIGSGRVVAINDVSLQGGGGGSSGSGPSNGTMMGGLLGGLGGIAIGASGGRGVGGGLIGGVLGAVGGAIAGTIIDRHTSIGGGGRGIEVVVQRDDGQQVTVAQRDDGDVQLGDRVQILQGRNGVAKAVRDNGRQPDQNGGYQNAGPAPQDYRQAGNYGGNYGGGGSYGGGGGNYGGNSSPQPQDYRQGQGQSPQDYGPQPADYGQQQRYAPPQSSSHSGYSSYGGGQGSGYSQNSGYQNSGYQDPNGPQPQNDPRYGTLQ